VGSIPLEETRRFATGGTDASLARSTALGLMSRRNMGLQMPPIATNMVDPQGVDTIKAWLRMMTSGNGYVR
jgi:hypothetical protein